MLVIVGAGPIGIELAVALRLCGVEFRILEAGCLASTIAWYAPGTEIFSSPERLAIAAIPFEPLNRNKACREDYLLYLRSVVRKYDLKIETNRCVVAVEKESSGGFSIYHRSSSNGVGGPVPAVCFGEKQTIRADKLVLAIGNMHLPNWVGKEQGTFPNVSHYLAEPHFYVGSEVIILGSGNSAAEAAIRLHRCGARVVLIQRGQGFRARKIKPWVLPELEALIRERKVSLTMVDKVIDFDDRQITVQVSGQQQTLRFDHLLLLTGYHQNTTLFDQLGIERHGPHSAPRLNPDTMESNVQGVYVIGTAASGSEKRVTTFIENSHIHVSKVMNALGKQMPFTISDLQRDEVYREL